MEKTLQEFFFKGKTHTHTHTHTPKQTPDEIWAWQALLAEFPDSTAGSACQAQRKKRNWPLLWRNFILNKLELKRSLNPQRGKAFFRTDGRAKEMLAGRKALIKLEPWPLTWQKDALLGPVYVSFKPRTDWGDDPSLSSRLPELVLYPKLGTRRLSLEAG